MGTIRSKIANLLESNATSPARILMLGLDGAGKTTLLYNLKLSEQVSTVPTIGFNVETVTPCKELTFTVWDVGGQTALRSLWKHHYQDCEGLIYVVDSSDTDRLDESRRELYAVLSAREMRGVPVLVLANKQDIRAAETPDGVADALYLRKLKQEWHVQGCCALTGGGVNDGILQLVELVKRFQYAQQRGQFDD